MVKLHLKLHKSIYNQLIHELLIGRICQRLLPPTPSQEMSMGNEPNGSPDYQFVTEWALPEDGQGMPPMKAEVNVEGEKNTEVMISVRPREMFEVHHEDGTTSQLEIHTDGTFTLLIPFFQLFEGGYNDENRNEATPNCP